MEECTNGSEQSISMGPADLISRDDASNEPISYAITDTNFLSPNRSSGPHLMGNLSLSSISIADSSQIGPLHAAFSPESDFRPDILMSTVNQKQLSVSQEDLSISIGPLPVFDEENETQCNENPNQGNETEVNKPITSLAANIEKFEIRRKLSSHQPPTAAKKDCKETQTETVQCEKCEELHIHYNQKLLEVANEFQQQYTSQFRIAEQHAAASDDAQKQIKDLKDELDSADKQLKANRAFLEQQAMEREQEREDASQQQKKLEALLAEKEKECDRLKSSFTQLTADVQHLQEALKNKEDAAQDHVFAVQRLEQEIDMLQRNHAVMDEENNNLQAILDVKDKLLKAQSEQIAALQNELENQLYAQSESEKESEGPNCSKNNSTLRDVADTSLPVVGAEMPSLFDELQQMIVGLLRKVDRSTKTLEAAQTTAQKKVNSNFLSPRSHITPATSTEDISIKDRNPKDLDGIPDGCSSLTAETGRSDPERALNFLQQLDNKLAILNRIEEAACKRISDLESELQRVTLSEKQSAQKATELEQQYKQHQLFIEDVEAEKRELQVEHTELLKRISSLENRLEEQRRSAALGASQNLHAEKCRVLSEEKHQLQLTVRDKEEFISSLQKQMNELHLRIDKLMKSIQEKEQESTRRTQDDCSRISVERLRDAPHQDGSMTWSQLRVQSSPVPLSPIYQPYQHTQLKHQETPHAVHLELDELKSKLAKVEREKQILEDEAACTANRMTELEALERRNAALDDVIEDIERQNKELQESNNRLNEELEQYQEKLKELEGAQERCVDLEKQLNDYKLLAKELEASRLSCATLEKELSDHKQSSRLKIDELKKRCEILESDLISQKNVEQECDSLRRKCMALESEATAQQGTVTAMEVLQQRCAALQNELKNHQQTTEQQCRTLKAQLKAKEESVKELQTKLKSSDSCRTRVEEALKSLQAEVDAIKQTQMLQQKEKSARKIDPVESSTLLEGPAAPPDLLAPSFIEFLGSTTSSRCSSAAGFFRSGSPANRAVESSTLHDISLPSSLTGKKVLKQVQKESEQLLAFGMQLLERKQNAAQQGTEPQSSAKQNDEIQDELECTLKPDGAAFEEANNAAEMELKGKVQLLETELAMERLLLQDQRTANARLQQQVMQLIAQQRISSPHLKPQQPQKSISSSRTLKPEHVDKVLQYRALKLESIRKNLAYQKRFLVGIVEEYDQNHNQRAENGSIVRKPFRRFRAAVLAVISIQRMRYILRQWRQRRRAIEASSDRSL